MNKVLFVIVCFLPLSSISQDVFRQMERSLKMQNQLPEELRNLKLDEDVFSLHEEGLQAEQGVKCLFPTLKILFDDLVFLPELSENFSRLSLEYKEQLTTLLQNQFRLTGNLAGGFGPPLPGIPPTEIFISTSGQMEKQLEKLASEINLKFESEADKTNWDLLPFEFQSALVKFLAACQKTEPILQNFYAPVLNTVSISNPSDSNEIFEKLMLPWKNRQLENFEQIKSMNEIDLSELAFATRVLSENLQALLRFNGSVKNEFKGANLLTKYGEISLLGNGKDTVTSNKFIVVDFGGDDLYGNNCGSNSPFQNQVGLLIDYAGSDVYKNENSYLNAGILGVSFLFDLGGDDKYIAAKPGLAFSLFGTSVLYDFSGNDYYSNSDNYSQGAAIAGISVLADLSGNDKYFCNSYSQGFGGTLGCGLLLDAKGDDLYSGVPENSGFSNPASFVQGASCGRWAEATDGQSLAGGFGILVDADGTDQYFAGSFSQGAGYFFGFGVFNDFLGNDSYSAISHSQGYAVHFALGNFCDYSGDDHYNENSDLSKITQIMGGGRDNSCGLFSDLTGNDTYYFGNRSAGIGDMRGTGCFYDPDGTNQFVWVANTVNKNSESIGKSLDLNGPANGFRLFINQKNWNSGLVLLKGKNSFQKEVQGNLQQFWPEVKNEINTGEKTIQILKN